MEEEELEELLSKVKELTDSEISLTELADELEISWETVMGLVNQLRKQGTNIMVASKDDDVYFLNLGDKTHHQDYSYSFKTDENNHFKFVAISDLRMGSKFSQLTMLNEVFLRAYNEGYRNFIITGNLTEGLYPMSKNMFDSLVRKDTYGQIDYVVSKYPRLKGMKTYFITGKKDNTHLAKKKIDIGKKIDEQRSDMVYIGNSRCEVTIDNVKMLILNSNQSKTYTQSYRAQKLIDAMRSEDKPNIMLYGGLLQCEEFKYRDVRVLEVPSLCATTWEMSDKGYSNVVGACFVDVETDKKGNLKSFRVQNDIYYRTIKDDYVKARVLSRGGDNND
jgi:biotin operon repressor